MTTEERIKSWKLHPSMRGVFGFELYKQMAANEDIFLIMADLGYGVFDNHKEDFPSRALSVGASEQAMMDMAVGLAQKGKIPFVYSITTFLLWRAAETIRLYINYEKTKVVLVGSGVARSYQHDGISHWADDIPNLLDMWENIQQFWPQEKEDVPTMLTTMIQSDKPSFIGLKR